MTADEPQTDQVDAQDGDAEFRETHRPFVRELNRSFASVYGFGGAAVLVSTALVPLVGWLMSALASPITWSMCVTIFLVSIFALRAFVRRRARRYRTAIDDYCEVNEVDPQRLREAYLDENMYPYFEAIFETIERREKLLAESNE
jgi:hypothetical protein